MIIWNGCGRFTANHFADTLPMKKLHLLALLMFVASARGQTPPAVPTSDANAGIVELRTGIIDSFVKGDIDRLLTYLDPDVVVTWQNGEVCRGRPAVRAYYEKMMTGPNHIVKSVNANPEVLGRNVYGDWGISWGTLHDDFILTDGSHLPLNTLFTGTIAKRGDHWLITGFHASVNAFENPVLNLAIHKTILWTSVGVGLIGLLLGFVIARVLGAKQKAA